MAHKVHIYDPDARSDEEGWIRPARTVETEDPEEAVRLARAELNRTGSMMAATVRPDWRLCPDLETYFRLTNAVADWLEENPIEGAWIGRLAEDPEHWAGYGVRTPEELEKYLLLTDYSELHKELTGFRPRGIGLTMQSPIEEIEAAYDRLRPGPAERSGDGPDPF
ncbi:MAG: hypothetical protein NXI18_22070 [Alphaproteobacteria bacterium]|nr:hypothetical protein [Alphaproteobacteria bacterium]